MGQENQGMAPSDIDLIESAADFRNKNPDFVENFQSFQQSFQAYLSVKERMASSGEAHSVDLQYRIVE